MHRSAVFHVVAILMLIISGFMLIPLGLSFYYGEYACLRAFGITILGSAAAALIVYFTTRRKRLASFSPRDGFLMVSASWIIASAIGALPFYLSGALGSYTDAYFETMSGFTTTGASIMTSIESMPKSILFWRSLTHWLGGMGIVMLTVALIPLLGIGGIKMVRAEAPGPTVDKLTPRITETAKVLWFLYLGLTVLETVLLMFGGMNLFDSLTHTFGTLATGGFSPKNASVGHYNSAYIDVVITVFMVLAGMNFGLYHKLFSKDRKEILKNTEMKAYLFIFFGATVAVALPLVGGTFSSLGESLRYAGFQVASILTTTGYATADYDLWPSISKFVLFSLMFVGGCAGSTGGGIKVIRIVTLLKQGFAEMKYLISPRGVFRVHLNKQPVKKDFVYPVTGFFILYISFLLLTTGVVSTGGYDLLSSFSTALATVGNIGPGFNLVGPTMNYAFFGDFIKWFLSFAMMAGRLELYTVFVLLIPHYYK